MVTLHAVALRHNIVPVMVFKYEMPHSLTPLSLRLKGHFEFCKVSLDNCPCM